MNTFINYSTKRLILGLLFLGLFAASAMAQGNDKMVVIKKNVSVAGANEETHYLAHVKSGGTWVLQDATTFSTNCIWYTGTKYNRTGTNHNYYFVDPDDPENPHFLSAPMTAGGSLSLSDTKPYTYVLSNTDLNYYFYDWDKVGIARGHQVAGIADAEHCNFAFDQGECWEVYWVEYDNGTWNMTDISAGSYGITPNAGRAYDLTATEHAAEVSGTPTGGLTALSAATEMTYGGSYNTPTVTVSNLDYTYVPAYTEYSFNEVTNEDGTTTLRTTYYKDGAVVATAPTSTNTTSAATAYKWTLTGEGAQYLSFESGSDVTTSTSTTPPTIYYRTENTSGHKTATLTLTVTFGTGSAQVEQTRTVDILVKTECKNPAQEATPVVNYDGVTVTWNATAEKYRLEWKKNSEDWSAASQTEVTGTNSYTITGLDNNTAYDYRVTAFCNGAYLTAPASATGNFTTKTQNSVLVLGAVFGGGRMADVNGKTEVVIINCDTLSAVYGGNDIAGEVKGANGSTITLGVNAGDSYSTTYNNNAASAKVVIGSVYGGGNGYYAYNGTSFVAADDDHTSNSVAAGSSVKAMTREHQVGDDVWENTGASAVTLNVPTITKTNITVTNNVVKVDSVFGGAKNAFISNTSGDNTYIAINGGTIFSVFGGNNFGGTLGAGSSQHIELAGTKTDLSDNARGRNNTYTSGFGRDFGIRYLFGGGNKVAGHNVIINVTGGQTDTVFGGGNAADVGTVALTVNCAMASGSGSTFGATYSDAINSTDGSTVTVKDSYEWNGSGLYNVRTLFGGNNAADMANLPTVTLTSGSVGTVYGGGNAGDMLAQVADGGSISGVFGSPMVDGVAQTIHYGTHVLMNSATMLADYIYGGCQKSNVNYSTWVEIEGGNAGTVYGGCNISGDVGSIPMIATPSGKEQYQYVQGATYVEANAGTIHKNLFGGSNGLYHCNDAVRYISGIDYDDLEHYYIGLEIPTHNETNVDVSGTVTVKGNVYAGGNLAPVGFINASSRAPFTRTFVGMATVRMKGGTVKGDVYGGGNMASVYGSNEVLVSGGTIEGALYGGNDRTGQVAQITNRALPEDRDIASDGKTSLNTLDIHTYVEITGTPSINTVYGGGNGAYIYSGPGADIEYCDVTDHPIQTNTFVDIHIDGFPDASAGGHIGTVYGGGNGVTVTGGITVLMNVQGDGGSAPMAYDHIGTIFGGNNMGDLAIVPNIILLQGQANTVYGGCNQGAMTGSTTVTGDCGEPYTEVGSLVRLRDDYLAPGSSDPAVTCTGTVSNAVYGGCRMNGVTNNSLVLVEGGTHACDVYGGSDISGRIGNTSRVVLCAGTVNKAFGGGNGDYYYDGNSVYDANDHSALIATSTSAVTEPTSLNSRVEVLGGNAANIYGGGNAAGVDNSAIYMTAGSVSTGIYGGCNSKGTVTGDVLIDILGGTVGTDADHPASGIFGGGYGQPTTTEGNVTVNIGSADVNTGATIYSDIYGGSALGTVNDAYADLTTVNILSGSVTGNIYGGGLGAATLNGNGYVASVTTEAIVNGTVHVNIGANGMTGSGATINGSVFGCNNLAGTPKGNVYVDVYKTAHTDSPDNRYPNPVPTTVGDASFAQAAYAINEVYGGGNLAYYVPTEAGAYPHVHIHNCDNTIEYVYGGGNAAQTPKNDVVIDGGRIYNAFAGGNGAGTGNPGANVVGDATITVNGGIIDAVFGGSNTLGNIGGTSTINLSETPTCYRLVKEVFGGGNQAVITGNIVVNIPCGAQGLNDVYGASNDANVNGNVTLNVWGGVMDNVYGGLKGVAGDPKTISGDVTVNIYGGSMNSVFGGCNVTGNILGQILVNINVDTSLCPNEQKIINVYGGGNQAAYTAPTGTPNYPEVNIIHGTVENNVYGGGLGATAIVTGNPVVTIGKPTTVIPASGQTTTTPTPSPNTYWSTVGNDVFGGGNAAQVTGNTKVIVINKSIINNNVYGGGNAATVTGNTDVQIGE